MPKFYLTTSYTSTKPLHFDHLFHSIKQLERTYLCGLSQKMSVENDLTEELWRRFMPERKRISNPVGTDLFSMQVYDIKPDFVHFDPSSDFTKWAAIEVSDHLHVPKGLYPYVLNGGLYAVFIHQGTPQQFRNTFSYIFEHWIPASEYELDHREHFERLPLDYSPFDPEAKEEVWVPIKRKPIL